MHMEDTEKAEKRKKHKVYVVTGATSALGILLVRELLKHGAEVRVVVRDPPKISTDWRTLPPGCIPYIVDLTLKDEGDKAALISACEGADVVFHLASATYNYKYKYSQMVDVNVIGTENLIKAYIAANPDPSAILRLIYTSSVSVYGYQRYMEELTEESEVKPASGYSETKLMAEKVIASFATADKRIKYTILRVGTLYGKGYESEFFKVFELIKNRNAKYIGNATNHLTLINVIDAAKALIAACDTPKSMNKIYNLTDGVPYTQKELFDIAAKFMNMAPPSRGLHPLIAKFGARIAGLNYDELEFLISDRVISIALVKKELGFKPSCDIDVEGKEMVKEYLKSQ